MIELYLVRQILMNADRVVSGLILTKVLLNGIVRDEFYLVRKIPKNTDRVVSGSIYLNWYRSKRLC